MPYFYIKNTGTRVEAVGLAIQDDYKVKDIYYASFAGPAEASRAVWAGAVGSVATGRVNNSYKDGKLIKPNRRHSVRLPGTNYVHYVMRSTSPYFFMGADMVISQIETRMNSTPASNGITDVESHARDLVAGWEPRVQKNYYERTELRHVREWLKEQAPRKAEMASKLVIAMNRITKVPIIPEWGPTLLKRLPRAAYESLSCYGDVLYAYLLSETYDYSAWVTKLMREGILAIPQPEPKEQ
jgi:hypothetical protein